MMSESFDHYHRWEPLAEFNFNFDDEEDSYDDNYIYCLCSRVLTRDGAKVYYADKEQASESDNECVHASHSPEVDDHSHVHFSLEKSHKKDEGASCYCSASHTDNYCSNDEHDIAQVHSYPSHALQLSDSGADLTYQDCHSDYTTLDKIEKMDQDISGSPQVINENYLSEKTWDKFWAINGERIIWASWIEKYSDYINPAYLGDNNDLIMDGNNVPKQHSVDLIYKNEVVDCDEGNIRERKFSYDSKVNPYKKAHKDTESLENKDKCNEKIDSKDDTWLPICRRRYSSEHDRIVSPKTLAGTDSMTNVTKITLSSYNVTSSHVTSESSPTDDYSVSSSTSDDQFNDQTRIANIDESIDQLPSEECDNDQYWQLLWKKHFGEQYALHYANYIESQDTHNEDMLSTIITAELLTDNKLEVLKSVDTECENSEGNSQELPSVIEVQSKIEQVRLDTKTEKSKSRKKKSTLIMSSVGVLLQNLLKEQSSAESCEVVEAGEETKSHKTDTVAKDSTDGTSATYNISNQQTHENKAVNSCNSDDDNEPPEKRSISLKRSHEIDDEESSSEKIKATLGIMGFAFDSDKMPKGTIIYKKRINKLRKPRYKRPGMSRKSYYDDDENAYYDKESQDDFEMQSDEENFENNKSNKPDKSKNEEIKETSAEDVDAATDDITVEICQDEDKKDAYLDGAQKASASDVDTSSDVQDKNDGKENSGQTKRKRRSKRSRIENVSVETSELPAELIDDPKMLKYWKKRHSLFHRFDEGVRLDYESWFSVTPESVARHIADRCTNDVIVDGFCGAGGNTIQFAKTCKKVIAIDIDPVKIELARHNASVYGVGDNIEFIVGDFFEIGPTLTADLVFLSPPWGGPKYSQNSEYDIETMLEPKSATELLEVARKINYNIALYLPRNSKTDQILSLAQKVAGSVEIEQSFLDKRYIAITAYFY